MSKTIVPQGATTDDGDMLAAALEYASRGRPVLPLHNPNHGLCSCKIQSCPSPAKHPLTPKGLNEASTDPDVIKNWWTKWPKPYIGVTTGRTSGLVVIDVDAGKGGLESWAELEDLNGSVETLASNTGGGGLHLFFEASDEDMKSTSGQVAAGVDTRAESGYVVAPPSLHISGNRYQWKHENDEGSPVTALPDWVSELFPKKAEKPKTSTKKITTTNKAVPEGQRNIALASVFACVIKLNSAYSESKTD